MLRKVEGPECPECGCCDSTAEAPANRLGQRWAWRQCNHCGRRWRVVVDDAASDGVIYRRLRCPECRSKNVRTTSSPLPLRRHRCRDCGHRFKSVEEL